MARPDGFPRQRIAIVPRPLVAEAGERPITRHLQVTDAGWYPNARGHERSRPGGAAESIVMLCVAGSGWVEMGGTRHPVQAPAVVAVPAGYPHRYGASDDKPWTIWWLHVRGSAAEELVGACVDSEKSPVAVLREVDRTAQLAEQIVAILEKDPSPPRLVRAAGMAWNLLTTLVSDLSVSDTDDPLQRAMNYLMHRLDSPVSVTELAREARVSQSHLGALFRAATGGGPLAHHITLRMARARQLLDGTDLAVAEVARETGYFDPLYFSRQFRQVHGESPSAYREQHKG
ncbi:AraC family transcriptional regulator [Glaciibacter superstes]|uniref:AraC family transcriptional regulator n=1 Tax=Glaciibacter superstes TaxID=501023 RepID=UPI0003B6231C|nr:AraC family transcriptional regulator [Glaciibacter superstes]